MIKVVHLACAHSSEDVRILTKECETLSRAGYIVTYITSYQSMKNTNTNYNPNPNLHIKGGGYDRRGVLITRDVFSFIRHRIKNKKIIFECVLDEQPDILHVHELELMYVVKKICRKLPSLKVIFDLHEDYEGAYYDTFLDNTNRFIAWIASTYIHCKLKSYIEKVDVAVTVTPSILEKTRKYNERTFLVRNYPILRHLEKKAKSWKQVVYCGMIARSRGIEELIACSNKIDARVVLAGEVSDVYWEFLSSNNLITNNTNVDYLGVLSQSKIWSVYEESYVGVCCYKMTRNNYKAYPTKLFEFMMAGLPVVCSDFPTYKEIINDAKCGIVADPNDIDAITNAINYLIENEDEANQMGMNGRKAIEEEYNWDCEATVLLDIYRMLAKTRKNHAERE